MFKKFLYLSVLACSMTACTEDFTDWFDPQANGQEEIKTVALNVSSVDAITLADVTTDSVQVFSTALTAAEAATATYEVKISDETNAQNLLMNADAAGRVAVSDLTNAIYTFYGKRPISRTMNAEVNVYVSDEGQAVRKQGKVQIVATAATPIVEDAYYLIGSFNGWDKSTVADYKFKHSDADVYDDPVFTLTIKAPTNTENGERTDFKFNIVPQSSLSLSGDAFKASWLGSDVADGDDRSEAGIAPKTDGADNAYVQYAADGAKFYKVTIHMIDRKMTVEPLSYEEYIYIPGNPQSWTPATAPMLRSASFDGVYTGFAYMDGNFKFTTVPAWENGKEYNASHFSTFDEMFGVGDGSNLNCTAPGYYYLTADVPAASLKGALVSFGIIGPAQAGGWDADTDMTYNKDEDCWETTLSLNADEMKFRANDAWDINLGGDLSDLTRDGANIRVAEAGMYTVKLYVSRSNGKKQMYATLTKAANVKKRSAKR